MALFVTAVTSIVCAPIAKRAPALLGDNRAAPLWIVCMSAVLVGLSLMSSFTQFVLLMAAAGLAGCGLNIAVNCVAAHVEQRAARSLMPMLHGFFSIGMFAGAGAAFVAARLQVSLSSMTLCAAIDFLFAVAFMVLMNPERSVTRLLASTTSHGGPFDRRLLPVLVFSFCSSFAECVIADWASIFLRDVLHTAASTAVLGFASFSSAMVTGRLAGGRVLDRFGAHRVVAIGVGTGSIVLTAGLLTSSPVLSVIAFGVFGLGISAASPSTYTAVARVGNASANITRLAMVSSVGSIVGAPVIGLLSSLGGLRVAMLAACGVAAVAALLARTLNVSDDQVDEPAHGDLRFLDQGGSKARAVCASPPKTSALRTQPQG